MQPNDDSRQQDSQLSDVLQEWQAPATPGSLEQRVLAVSRTTTPQPWWRFLLNGYIRVPVPVACCVAVVVIFAAWRSVRPPSAGAPCSIAARPSVCTSSIPGAC
jgi:hypothetical protein